MSKIVKRAFVLHRVEATHDKHETAASCPWVREPNLVHIFGEEPDSHTHTHTYARTHI